MPLKFSTSRAAAADLITSARQSLGQEYGLGRPLRKVELAKLVGVTADFIYRLERGQAVMSGPVQVVIGMLTDGHRSPWHEQALASRGRAKREPGAS